MATSIINPARPWIEEPAIVPVQEELVKAAVLQETHASAPGNNRLFSVEIQRNITSAERTSASTGDYCDGNEATSEIKDFPFKVVTHLTSTGTATDEESGERECRYASSAEEALQIYEDLYKQHASSGGEDGASMQPVSTVNNSRWVGSEALRKTLLYRETYAPTQDLSPEVATLVDNVWKEAMGKLKENLAVPVSAILPGQVTKAEAVLYQMWNKLQPRKSQQKDDEHRDEYDEESFDVEMEMLAKEFYDLIPHHDYMRTPVTLRSRVANKMDLCQMIRDAVYINEETGWQKRPTPEAKYRALRCYIQHLPADHPEYQKIRTLVLSTLPGEKRVRTFRIFAVSRPPDEEGYLHDIGNDTLLFHATKPNNVLGILSRGLLMPKVVVEMFNGQRRDEGLLGPGLYFGDRTSTCVQYTKSGYFSNTRMMFVIKVALGSTKDFYEFNTKLHQAPEGFHSTHGVRASEIKPSEFTEDEFVVYSTRQQCIRYLVEFSIVDDDDMVDGYEYDDEDDDEEDELDNASETMGKIDLVDVHGCQDPVSRTATGLVVANSREGVLLEEVHVRGQITDLAAKITVLQVYQSQISETNVKEARYVFPLDEKAAVCGFEAFINGKHVVGTVKTKEQAKTEYKEAVREGHGAYLMQEEASNVFSVSIGNLPPRARVVIKITYVTELGEEEGGKMAFYLLGSVAPWLREQIRGTQLTEEKQAMTGVASNVTERKESFQLTMEMASDISSLESLTHTIIVKRENMKATVALGDGVHLGDGFQLLITVIDPNTPRMWTEFDPSHNSYASMAVFYPTILSELTDEPEVVLLLDCSTSMKGQPKQDAQKICKLILRALPKKSRFNVITFGTDFTELFPTVETAGQRQLDEALEFIENARSVGGSSEAWRPLRSLSLLPLKTSARNILLLSDGHLTNEKLTLEIASKYKSVNRIFTCAVSSTENRHTLRALADVSGGAFESFNPKAKSKWEGKVTAQVERCRQPSVSCVKATWQTEQRTGDGSEIGDLIQVPAQTSSVFTGSKVLLFSLGPKVKEVHLSAQMAGQNISESLVSRTEPDGTSVTLHRLAARALVRDWEIGSFDQDAVSHETRMYDLKKYLTDLSIRLSIITPLTSFIAVEKRDGETPVYDVSPDVANLLSLITRDDLESSRWCEVVPDQEGPPDSMVAKILKRAKIAQSHFSYSSAEKYYTSAFNIAKENISSMQSVFQTCCLEISRFTLRVKGNAEKALEWIQPAVTHVAEQDREDEEVEALDRNALEFSQLLNNIIHEGQPEMSDMPFDTSIQSAPARPAELEELEEDMARLRTLAEDMSSKLEAQDRLVAKADTRAAVRFKSKGSMFSFFKNPFKAKKKRMEPDDVALAGAFGPAMSAAPSISSEFERRRAKLAELSEKSQPFAASSRRSFEPTKLEEPPTALSSRSLEPSRPYTTISSSISRTLEPSLPETLDSLMEKAEDLERSSKVFAVSKGKKKSWFSSLLGRMTFGSGRPEEEVVNTIPTIGFSGDIESLIKAHRERRREPASESMRGAISSQQPQQADDDTIYEDVSSQGVSLKLMFDEASEDEYSDDMFFLAKETDTPSIKSLTLFTDDEDQSSPPSAMPPRRSPLPLGGEPPMVDIPPAPPLPGAGAFTPPPPPPPPPIGAGIFTPIPTGVSPPPPGAGVPPPPPPPPGAGVPPPPPPPPGVGVPPPPLGADIFTPTPPGAPSRTPPPPPPIPGTLPLPTTRIPLPPTRIPLPPTPAPPSGKEIPILQGWVRPSSRISFAPSPEYFDEDVHPAERRTKGLEKLKKFKKKTSAKAKGFGVSLGASDMDDEDIFDMYDDWKEETLDEFRSPYKINDSKRNMTEVTRIIKEQDNNGSWIWKNHKHLLDELFDVDLGKIVAYCIALPATSLVGKDQDLHSIILTLCMIIFLREMMSSLDPGSVDTEGHVGGCIKQARDWLSRQHPALVRPIQEMLEANLISSTN